MGKETVTLGGITVEQQEVGLVNLAGWIGDDFTSGLLGLAYPSITSAFAGMLSPTPRSVNKNILANESQALIQKKII